MITQVVEYGGSVRRTKLLLYLCSPMYKLVCVRCAKFSEVRARSIPLPDALLERDAVDIGGAGQRAVAQIQFTPFRTNIRFSSAHPMFPNRPASLHEAHISSDGRWWGVRRPRFVFAAAVTTAPSQQSIPFVRQQR